MSDKSLAQWMDSVFGNNDGKLDWKDIPNSAPAIVTIVVDILMLFAEYRVYSAGYALTENHMLALGFVAVSSVPFYLGQLAWLYNKANWKQQVLAITMICMGLAVSGFFGFTDYVISTVSSVSRVAYTYTADNLYEVAIYATISLIVAGLLFGFFDDEIANKLKENRMMGRARVVEREMDTKERLLAKYEHVKKREDGLRKQYGNAEVDRISKEFTTKAPMLTNASETENVSKVNPTQGAGQ